MASEKRMIDANALMKAIKSFRWWGVPNTLQLMFDYLKIIIRDQPTVDAVEVVRCKDCKHWNHMEDGIGDCTNLRFHLTGHADPTMGADDFCSCGERKDND